MLVDHNSCLEALNCRILGRGGKLEAAVHDVESSINMLLEMKNEVEQFWRSKNLQEEKLSLNIRQYNSWQFGPLYQIGDEVMFIGFYPVHLSSINAPILEINREAQEVWDLFEQHFYKAWNEISKEFHLINEKL